MSKKPSDIRTFFKIKEPVTVSKTDEETESECIIKASPGPGCSSSKSCHDVSKEITSSYVYDEACSSKLDLGDIETGPSRPILTSYPLSEFKNSKRAFTPFYFKKFDWLEYSIKKDAVFCYACRIFSSNNKEVSITEKGISNWKKIGEKLEKHASSDSHLFSMAKWHNYRKPTDTVASAISSSHKELISENREYFQKILDLLLFLAKQGMSFRGHNESETSGNKGNYLELCDLFSKYDGKFRDKYERYFNLTSHDFQNEIFGIVTEEVLSQIVNEVNQSGFYALMVDEAKSHRVQQLCICIRYLFNSEIKERLLTMKDVSLDRSAESLANIILSYLREIGITAILIGQSHDGASVMSGVNNGLQKIIRDTHSLAMYVHCLAHKVNLVLVNACESNNYSCFFFNVMQSLYVFFSNPDTHAEYKILQDELQIKAPGPHEIHKLSDTRWSCRATAVQSVNRNFDAICAVLKKTANDLRDSKSPQAKGLLGSITSLDFVVCLVFLLECLTDINILSKALQREDSCIARCAKAAGAIIMNLKSRRSENAWEKKWNEIIEFSRIHDINLFPENNCTLTTKPNETTTTSCSLEEEKDSTSRSALAPKRRRVVSKKLDEYFVMSTVGQASRVQEESSSEMNSKVQYRCDLYYPILDILINELQRRFAGEAMEVANASEEFLCLNVEKAQSFLKKYPVPGLNQTMLISEMSILRCILESDGINPKDIPLKELVKILTEMVLNQDDIYPNFKVLFKICLTLPSNSATCERSFSTMRRINQWLRSSMGQERFSNLVVLYSESDLVKSLNFDKLMDEYAKKGNRKLPLI